jgi:hypothetical protein
MKEHFSPELFAPTKLSSAREKAKFANYFREFVLKNFDRKLFVDWFYSRMSMCRGHIAHYNLGGFYEEWFSDPDKKIEFLRHWATAPSYGDPKYTYSDVEKVLASWIFTEGRIEAQELIAVGEKKALAEAAQQERKRVEALAGQTHQAFKVFRKSENTNSFGLHGYWLAARDGTVYSVGRSLTFPWQIGEVVQTPLTDGRLQWHHLGVEIPERRLDMPKKLTEEIWAIPEPVTVTR